MHNLNEKQMIFLGGAPKCGTSAFFSILKQTYFFCPSHPKETFFYIDRDYPLRRKEMNFFEQGHSAFSKFFNDQSIINKPILEGTTHLLYQKNIPKILSSLNCKVIFILRDPAERIRSSFEYTLNNLGNFKETISFSEYVDLLLNDDQKTLEKKMRSTTSQWVLANGLYLSNYPIHINGWNEALGKNRVLVLSYNDFKKNPGGVVKKTIKFAGISEEITQINAEKRNATKGIRNKNIHKKLSQLNRIVPESNIKNWIKSIYFKFQTNKRIWKEDDEIALQKLKNYFVQNQLSIDEIINDQKINNEK